MLVLLIGLALSVGPAAAQDLVKVPPLTARVTDLTNTLSAPEREALDAKLAAWEAQTGNQLVVLMLPSTQPEAIAAYSIRVAEAWKIGHKGKDNGAVFLIAKNDRKNRIEVGYGLEGVLTDVTTRRILAETVAPYFRNNQFAQGINAGVDQVIAVVNKGEPLADSPAVEPPQRKSGGISFDTILILLFVVVPVIGGILQAHLRQGGRVDGRRRLVGGAAWLFAGSLVIAHHCGRRRFHRDACLRPGWRPRGPRRRHLHPRRRRWRLRRRRRRWRRFRAAAADLAAAARRETGDDREDDQRSGGISSPIAAWSTARLRQPISIASSAQSLTAKRAMLGRSVLPSRRRCLCASVWRR